MADVVDHPLGDQEARQLARLQVENGRSCSVGLDFAIFLISRRSGSVNVFGRPPEYFGYRELKPLALKLWITSRTRSALVKVTSAIFATGMPWADSRTIWARRQVTTEPVPRRMIRSSLRPSSSSICRTRTCPATTSNIAGVGP